MVAQSLCQQMQISEREVATLVNYLRLGPGDWTNLEVVRNLLANDVGSLVDDFYAHITQFDRVKALLSDPDTRARVRQTMSAYLTDLGKGANTLAYFEERLRTGFVHEGLGLGLKWHMGGYSILTESISRFLASRAKSAQLDSAQLTDLIVSVEKIFSLDSLLAIETYHFASNQRLEDVLSKQYTIERELRRHTSQDGLTGTLNRESLLEAMEVEFLRSQRFHRAFSVMLLDVDKFKEINDRLGHAFGDFVLKRIVELVQSVLRPGDVLGRYGGDEIVVALPGCRVAEARSIAERIRLKVTLAPFEHKFESATATLSVGVAESRPGIASSGDLLELADRALYEAKRAGRNQTRVYRHAEPDELEA